MNSHNFLLELSQPAQRALLDAGHTTLEQISCLTEKELRQLHGVGPKTIRQLREFLAAEGKSLQ